MSVLREGLWMESREQENPSVKGGAETRNSHRKLRKGLVK